MSPLHAALLFVEAVLRFIVALCRHRGTIGGLRPCNPLRVVGRPPQGTECRP